MRSKGYYSYRLEPARPGHWGILYFGRLGPEAQFERHLPALAKIRGSYRIDDRFAAEYIARGIENLKRQMAKTSQMMAATARSARESSMAAFQERARSSDYIDYKRTATRRR